MTRAEVVMYGKEGCHLCEAVEAQIRAAKEIGMDLTVADIDKDPALHDRYWLRIPVVAVKGREVFEAKMMDPAGNWKDRLLSLLAAPPTS